MKNLLALLTLTIICNSVSAQQNFQSGSVVTLAGETLTGEIDYKNWQRTPETIRFRKGASSTAVDYGVNDITSFTVSNETYKRGVVEIIGREDVINKLRFEDEYPSKSDTVFLRTLVSGPKSLYNYTDNVEHFYITNEEGKFELLVYKKFKKIVERDVKINYNDEMLTIVTLKTYISQLSNYFSNCSKVNDDLKYRAADLRKAFMSYYDCAGSKAELIQDKEEEKFEFVLLAGVANTSFNASTESDQMVGRVGYSKSNDVTAGVAVDIVFPRQRGRVSFTNELMYSSYKTKGVYHYTVNPFIFDDYTYEFQYSYVKLNNMLRYKFLANNYIIFINGGVSNGIVIKEVNRFTQERTANGVKSTAKTGKAFEDTRKWELGILAGAGVRVKRASLELRAERGFGPFSSPTVAAKVQRYTAVFGYRLK
jgi:hypothetical protein